MLQLTVFRGPFLLCCCKFSTKIFFYRPVNSEKPNLVSSLIFVWVAASFIAKISSFETVAKREAFWIPSQNSEYPRIFRVKGANQNARKTLSTDLVNTKHVIMFSYNSGIPFWGRFSEEEGFSTWQITEAFLDNRCSSVLGPTKRVVTQSIRDERRLASV